MDEKQLYDDFLSIISESHPGLTFEEYRDSCTYLLFYQYLCLKFADSLEDSYKLKEMVRLAVRGKLQLPSFLRFMENAGNFLHVLCPRFDLMECTYIQKIRDVKLSEKQKSYARFIRKFIKKIDKWDCDELLLAHYPVLFRKLVEEFSRMKKTTYISDSVQHLFALFFSDVETQNRTVFLPEFRYGILMEACGGSGNNEVYGFDRDPEYLEILQFYAYMAGIEENQIHLFPRREWLESGDYPETFDCVAVFQPEGVEEGALLSDLMPLADRDLMTSKSKGEFPYLLSAMPMLKDGGAITAILPSALLYREGKEQQIRKAIVEDLQCLDTVMLLPDGLFQSAGQDEVLLYLKRGRSRTGTMFFDCSDQDDFNEEFLQKIEKAWKEGKTIPGLCTKAETEQIRENDYNLNLPRYIVRTEKSVAIDIEAKKKRIAEIDAELREIEDRIAMYRRDLGGI